MHPLTDEQTTILDAATTTSDNLMLSALTKFSHRLRETESGCQEFMGSRNTEGYGNIWYEGKCWKAHRFSWRAWKGPIPEDMLVCHTCDNPPCCNIDHLFLGTNLDNTLDKVRKGRMAPTHGANNPAAILTEDKVWLIHELLYAGNHTQQELANMFMVSKGHINNIKAGRTWNYVFREIYNHE